MAPMWTFPLLTVPHDLSLCETDRHFENFRNFIRQKQWEQDGQDRDFEDAELLRLVSDEAKHQLVI